jgi:mono/diheme cytochrome c family protein
MIISKLVGRLSGFMLAFLFATSLLAAPTVEEGKALFVGNCATCHAKNMKDKLTGPPLAGALANWGGDKARIYKWIRNSSATIASGDPRAVAIWNEYKPTVMTSFPNLKDDQIESILLYIDCTANGTCGGTKPSEALSIAGADGTPKESNSPLMWVVIFGILATLAVVLSRIISNLNYASAVKAGLPAERKTLTQTLTSKTAIGFTVFALVVLGGYTTVNNAISMGRQQGYAPSQPIKFSHKTHAGINKIDCQYCHDSARRSKHSSIPGTNTCMNCHSAIKKGSQYGTAEISKIYASIGFDPSSGKYIDGYENYTTEQIEGVFKKWIGDTYLADHSLKNMDENGKSIIEEQWTGIKTSLTNDTKFKIQGPIEWTRIHNLPDHAYFNHAQHVSVGKVECQKCHGKVEGMEILAQHSPLSMGWCINCHRETKVNFTENKFYDNYKRYHDELKSGERTKVTVEDIGGLECQKCHY